MAWLSASGSDARALPALPPAAYPVAPSFSVQLLISCPKDLCLTLIRVLGSHVGLTGQEPRGPQRLTCGSVLTTPFPGLMQPAWWSDKPAGCSPLEALGCEQP